MRTAPSSFACLAAAAALGGALIAGCGTATQKPTDGGSQKNDMTIFFPGCDNGAIDSGETDIDCGGPCEKKCAENMMCKTKADCAGGLCIGGVCTSAKVCSDGLQNGDETDIDCGGSCRGCTFDKNCLKPTDCLSSICTAGKCAPLKAALGGGKAVMLGTGPVNVDTGDFDGDGKVDLVALSNNSDFAAIALGKGDGTFGKAFTIAVPQAEGPYTLVTGDVDGDGKTDIVYTNVGKVSVLLNAGMLSMTGAPTFKKEVSTVIGSDPGWPQLRDLDGDGKLDLLTADTTYDDNANGYNIYLSGNMDGGKWKVLRKIFCDIDRPTSVVMADFNDDTFIDVAAIVGGAVQVSLQTAGAANTVNAFGLFKKSLTGMLTPTQIVAGELDSPADYHVDVTLLDRNAGAYGVMGGVGDGTLLRPAKIAVANGPAMMAITDFDLDGKPDVATANYDTDSAGVLLGKGDRTYTQGPLKSANPSPNYIIVRDVNGDGKPDLITANPGSDLVTVLLNTST